MAGETDPHDGVVESQVIPQRAETINWDAPIMSNSELAKTNFAEMERFFEDLKQHLLKIKEELIEKSLWDDFIRFANLSLQKNSLLSPYSIDKLPYLDSKEEKKAIDNLIDLANASRHDSDNIHELTYERCKEIQSDKIRISDVFNWYEDKIFYSDDPEQKALLESPYFFYLMLHLDEINTEEMINIIKSCYRVVTLEDHIRIVQRCLTECVSSDQKIYIYLDRRKQGHSQDKNKKREEEKTEHFNTSDEFMIDLLKEIAEKHGIEIVILRNSSDVIENFNLANIRPSEWAQSLGSIRIIVIDDLSVSGSQKQMMLYEFGELFDGIGKLNSSVKIMSQIFKLYFAGASKSALNVFNRLGVSVTYEKQLPTIKELVPEPYLSLIRHGWYLYGTFPYIMFPFIKIHGPADVEQKLELPIVVSPFKVPDYVSTPPFWTQSIYSKHYLFPLASDEESSPSAYIRANHLLD